MKKATTPEARACNEGRSWARREWRATVGSKRGEWRGTLSDAISLVASPNWIAVSQETEQLAVVLNAAAAEEWERLRSEARI